MEKVKKYNKKIVHIIIMLIVLMTSMGIGTNRSEAASYLINEAELYSKAQIITFKYKGEPVRVEFVVYKKGGVEYPAYCLNRELPGVELDKDYHIDVEKEIESTAIWKVIVNGYPFKTPQELGCTTIFEAYAATKMAVFDAMYHYDWDDFSPLQEAGQRAITAAEKISKTAKNSTQTRPSAKIDIVDIGDGWQVDETNPNNVIRTYQVNTNLKSTKYSIKLTNTDLNSIIITDKDGKEKTEFNSNETFRVSIPIIDLQNDGSFELQVTADMETWPILYGETGNDNVQDYAVTAGYISYEDVKTTQKYFKNKTKIEIIKKDTETGELLQGAKFKILNENKEEIYSGLETNKDGTVTIENILPGKYYIEEIKAPDGYTGYEEIIEVDVKLNQTYTVEVNNYEKPAEEEKEVDDNKITVTGKQEISLPRTGF